MRDQRCTGLRCLLMRPAPGCRLPGQRRERARTLWRLWHLSQWLVHRLLSAPCLRSAGDDLHAWQEISPRLHASTRQQAGPGGSSGGYGPPSPACAALRRMFDICLEPERCSVLDSYDAGDGLALWFVRLWQVRPQQRCRCLAKDWVQRSVSLGRCIACSLHPECMRCMCAVHLPPCRTTSGALHWRSALPACVAAPGPTPPSLPRWLSSRSAAGSCAPVHRALGMVLQQVACAQSSSLPGPERDAV